MLAVRRPFPSALLRAILAALALSAPVSADALSLYAASSARLALADPQAVPAGVYARKWLESTGVWGRLADKVVPALNVRAALAAVESGNVDAGVVYRTDAAASSRVEIAFFVPREQGPGILYPLAPLACSKKPGTAALLRALTSPAAREAYARHGFVVLGEK